MLVVFAGFMLEWADIGILFVSAWCIFISLIILIVFFIVQLRKSYVAKDPQQRLTSRKRGWIITFSIFALIIAVFITASFMNGYRIPQWDKHSDWNEFPKGSNPDVVIDSIVGVTITNIDTALNSDHYFVHYFADTLNYYDAINSGPISFGIMDKQCKIKVRYNEKVSVYLDDTRLIVINQASENDSAALFCDVYNVKTLQKSRQEIHSLKMPPRFKYYPGAGEPVYTPETFYKKYRDNFFDDLKGIKSLEENTPGENVDRGYILFTDKNGKLYRLKDYEDDTTLGILCKNCDSYKYTGTVHYKTSTKNIVLRDESILWENNLNSGLSLGFGNPNGNGNDGFYFYYYPTWLMYYDIHIGNQTTSFKAEGGAKDKPYLEFLQLNEPKSSSDTLYFAADNKLWKVYRRQ